MRLVSCCISATLATGLALLAASAPLSAQQPGSALVAAAAEETPDAPLPQIMVAAAEPPAQQSAGAQSQSTPPPAASATPAQNPGSQQSSSSQTAVPQRGAEKSQHEKAEEQIKEQEKQHESGIPLSSNVVYGSGTVSLTSGQKMSLALRSTVDPIAFAKSFAVAGYHEVLNDDKVFGWGVEGYGKGLGAAYLDSLSSKIIGNGVLPILLHQDPRFFRLGQGTTTHRLLYAMATTVICKHDNTGKWEPNYSNVLGDLASSGLSNLYYPSRSTGISQTFTGSLTGIAVGGLGSTVNEFWPDVSRKLLHRDPTNGLDAQARAADQAKKIQQDANQTGK